VRDAPTALPSADDPASLFQQRPRGLRSREPEPGLFCLEPLLEPSAATEAPQQLAAIQIERRDSRRREGSFNAVASRPNRSRSIPSSFPRLTIMPSPMRRMK
jgi:hypothetical protein